MVRALAVSVAAFLVACGLSPAAFAQGADPVPPLADPVAPAATENGRFTMKPAGAGFLRLDTRSGAVSYCSLANGAAECRAAADDRAALMAEIDRLSRHAAQPGAAPASPPPTASPGVRSVPDRQEMDQALDFAERFMRRMMRIMRDEKRDPT